MALGWRGPGFRALFRGFCRGNRATLGMVGHGAVAVPGPVAVSRPCRERRRGHFGAGRLLGRYSALSLLLLRAVREMCMILGLGWSPVVALLNSRAFLLDLKVACVREAFLLGFAWIPACFYRAAYSRAKCIEMRID